MADSKESREVGFKVTDGCGNEVCYCDGSCREDKAGDLSIKVTADVGGAITGFKALSRELREATKAARELEQAYSDVGKAKDLREGSVIIDGKKVAKAVAPAVKELQDQTLKDALINEPNIPDRLRDDLLAKISEDEDIIAELKRKLDGKSNK